MSKIGSILAIIALAAIIILVGYGYRENITGGAIKAVSAKKCFDGDGGKDFYLKGEVTLGSDIKTDFCAARPNAIAFRSNHPGDLIEYYCKNDSGYDSIAHACPNGCKDGACNPTLDDVELLEPIAESDAVFNPCADSDNGKIHSIKGRVSGSTINPKTAQDGCVLMGGKNVLAERYCFSKDTGAIEYYDCSKEGKSCERGMCVAMDPVAESTDLKWLYSVVEDKVITKEPGCSYGGVGNYKPIAPGYVNIGSGLSATEEAYRLFIGRTMNEYCDENDNLMKWEFYCDSHGYAHIVKVRCDRGCQAGACKIKGG